MSIDYSRSFDYDRLEEVWKQIDIPPPWKVDAWPSETRPGGTHYLVVGLDDSRVAEMEESADQNYVEQHLDLVALAPDMARELIRLRDGVEVIRDRCTTLAKSAQNAGIRTLAREMDINAKALTGLLNGGTE